MTDRSRTAGLIAVALAAGVMLPSCQSANIPPGNLDDDLEVASVAFALSGPAFVGNSVRICGTRVAPPGEPACLSRLPSMPCNCYEFDEDGTVIDPGGAALVLSGLCPSSLGGSDWDFEYQVFTDVGCNGIRLNDGNHAFTCYDVDFLGSRMSPNHSIETLDPGININQVVCVVDSTTKSWGFTTCLNTTTTQDNLAMVRRFDCGCVPSGDACDCGAEGLAQGDFGPDSDCSILPIEGCNVVCPIVASP